MSRRGQAQEFSIRKKRQGVRSMVMGKIFFPSTPCLALVLWLVAACGNSQEQALPTATSKTRASHEAVSCTKDAQCPSGHRCGFTFGCESKGKCIVPSGKPSCINPGGRCGCDGRPVEILCAVGLPSEYTSVPANAVGPCPRPCTEEIGCGSDSGLACQKGFCVKP
jgi:hypothetical protein